MLPYLCQVFALAQGKSQLRTQGYVDASSLSQASLTDLGQNAYRRVRKPPAEGSPARQD